MKADPLAAKRQKLSDLMFERLGYRYSAEHGDIAAIPEDHLDRLISHYSAHPIFVG